LGGKINFKAKTIFPKQILSQSLVRSEREKERERELFKVFTRKLQILKLNLKLTSGTKILKIWI
jgi:hypothetical protein